MTTTWESSYFTAARHEATVTPEQTGAIAKHPIVIVGAGPVGMVTALLLARLSVPTVLLEAKNAVGYGSRAICVSARSLEILAHCGILSQVLNTALPWTGGRSFYRDRLVLNFEMAIGADLLPPMVNIQQCILEQMLVGAIEAEPLIDLRWDCRVAAIEQQSDVVSLHVESPLGDYDIASSWIAACDGPQSVLRDILGQRLRGETHDGRYVIVDLHMESTLPTERLCWFSPPTFPGKTVLLHKQPFDIWRLDYQIDEGESIEDATDPNKVLPLVEAHLAWMGESKPWKLEWLSSYGAHSLTLDSFRVDRVLFAGDAAHLVPIFGVRGLNGGLADALNLAWKLAAVIGGADDQLLESYSLEQRSAALDNIDASSASARFMSPPSKAAQLMRDAVLSLSISVPDFRSLVDPRQTTAAVYGRSKFLTEDRSTDNWTGGPQPGNLAPNVEIEGRRLQEVVGLSSALLIFGKESHQFDIDIAQVFVTEPSTMAVFDADDHSVYLLRPDRYVTARWRRPNRNDIERAMQKAHLEELSSACF